MKMELKTKVKVKTEDCQDSRLDAESSGFERTLDLFQFWFGFNT